MSPVALNHARLHHAIINHIVARGHAPDPDKLALMLGATRTELDAALKALQEYHGVVLHPNSSEVWVIHPFSLAATNFWVEVDGRGWWGNCAWCSLGMAALLSERGPVSITSTLAGQGVQIQVRIENGVLNDGNLVIHFPVPMRHAWDNVIYTCSTMLFFRDESQVDEWCDRHRVTRGDVRPAAQIWAFAKDWYGAHLRPDWRKWTAAEARALFRRHGLTGPIWDIPASNGRF